MIVKIAYLDYSTGDYSSYMEFDVLRFYQRVGTESNFGKTLSGFNFAQILSKNSVAELVFTSDQLNDSAKYNFIVNMYYSKSIRIIYNSQITNWIITNDEAIPLEFPIEDNTIFPELKFDLVAETSA